LPASPEFGDEPGFFSRINIQDPGFRFAPPYAEVYTYEQFAFSPGTGDGSY